MNKLSKYLEDNGIMHKFFAKKIGVSTTTLSHILKNIRMPTLKTAIRIREETKEKISVDDWVKTENTICKDEKKKKNQKKYEAD